MRREDASFPHIFGLHQPRQCGRHDPFAIVPGDPGRACEMCIGRLASTSARQSAGATGRHEMECWLRGMVVLFSMLQAFSFTVRSFFTDFTPGTCRVVQDAWALVVMSGTSPVSETTPALV